MLIWTGVFLIYASTFPWQKKELTFPWPALECLKFSTWAGLRHLMHFYVGTPQPLGNLQFCKYKLLLYGKAWRRLSSKRLKRHMNWCVWIMCPDVSLEKKSCFSSVESCEPLKCHHEKLHEQTRFPSRTDEISFLYVSPKSNWLRKRAQNSGLWCQRELWIETLQSFLLPENSTRHTATSSGVNVENRDSERYFKLFNHLLLREDDEVPQNAHWFEN